MYDLLRVYLYIRTGEKIKKQILYRIFWVNLYQIRLKSMYDLLRVYVYIRTGENIKKQFLYRIFWVNLYQIRLKS